MLSFPRFLRTITFFVFLGLVVSAEASRADSPKIKKFSVLNDRFAGRVRNIQIGKFIQGRNVIAIVPQTDTFFLDPSTFALIERKEFLDGAGEPIWFGLAPKLIPGPGGFRIVKGGEGFGDIGMLDITGKTLWAKTYRETYLNALAVGPGVDGKILFFAGGSNGLQRLNDDGKVLWSLSEPDIFDLRVVQWKGQQAVAGLVFNQALAIFSADGKKLSQLKKPWKGFDAIDWLGKTRLIGLSSSDEIILTDLNGREYFKHHVNNFPVYHGPNATPFRLEADKEALIAVLVASSSRFGKSQLSLFSTKGELIYQEELNGGSGIASVPDTSSPGKDILLVGDGTEHVWGYKLAD